MAADRPQILLAEDNPGLAHVIQFNLKQAGFDVTVCFDGLNAWEALEKGSFDVVVTDYDMPGINGGEVCRRLRQSDAHADLPVIMITGREMETEVRAMREQWNLVAMFAKPYSPKELVRTVQQVLTSSV